MVVCKFFQQGSCRYGQSCRFEHIYSSKYSYHAPDPHTQQNQNSSSGVTDEQLVNQVQKDIQCAVHGNQWLLSCYAPFTEKPNFPGIADLSFEEARLFIYEAKANNTLENAVSFMGNLFQEGRRKYEALLQPTPNIVKTLRSLYRREPCSSPFTTGQTFGNASATSIFRGAAQGSSAFGQNSNQAQSIFAQANQADANTAAKSIFAQATQSVFGGNQQGNQSALGSQQSQTIFSGSQQTNQQPASVFGSAQPNSFFTPLNNTSPQSIFASQNTFSNQEKQSNPSSIFASASQQAFGTEAAKSSTPFASTGTSNIFQSAPQPSNVFGGNTNVFEQQGNFVAVYSTEDELSADDLEIFKADHFKFGFVPELPPTQSLCH